MKIGLIIYGSLDTLSGGYLYDRQLVALLRDKGCTVDLLSLPWRSYGRHLLDNFRTDWARTIAAANYDVLLQDELNHPSLFLLNQTLRRHCTCPIVSVVHHLRLSEEHPAYRMPFYQFIESRYLRSVDGFVFNSKTTRDIVYRQIAVPKPGVVAYPAADHRQPPPNDRILAKIADHMQRNDAFQLLFVGNLMARKGLHTVLDALAQLRADHWHLHVVGSMDIDPQYSRAMRQRAAQLSLTSRLTWHGRVDDTRLMQLFWHSDMLVMPSYEGFGIVYLEAMAYGLPVLASHIGAAPEIVQNGIHGYLVPHGDSSTLADRLALLLHNRIHWATLAYHARHRYDNHPTWRESMNLVYDWLREAAGKAPTP